MSAKNFWQKYIIYLAISIMVVYFLVLLISWLLDKKRADQLMKDLEMYQQNVD